MTIPDEARNWARELYVIDGLSLEQTARETDIPIGTVKRWSSDDGWFEEKQQYRRQLAAIDQDTVRLKKLMTERAIQTLDPQVIHCLSDQLVDKAVRAPRAIASRNAGECPGPLIYHPLFPLLSHRLSPHGVPADLIAEQGDRHAVVCSSKEVWRSFLRM